MFKRLLVVLLLGMILTACGASDDQAVQTSEEPTNSVPTANPTEIEPTAPEILTEGQASFRLIPEESIARFRIGEVLSGQDNVVVGITSAVEGSFTLDLANPAGGSYDPILVEASTLVTDNDRRNGAIQRFILETNQVENELIVFQPLEVDELPETVTVGESYQVEIRGDLTIHSVTREEQFSGVVAAVSSDRLEGSLSTVIQWAEYDITIPQVALVASVDDELILEFEFVAVRQ